MSKYNCSKCLDYAHEEKRMCEAKFNADNRCYSCKLFGTYDCELPDMQEKIDIVQEWSDEHPEPHEKTLKENFLEKFPNAPMDFDDVPRTCVDNLYGTQQRSSCELTTCSLCWNRLLSEVTGKIMKKLFISQPMKDKTNEEINKQRKQIAKEAVEITGEEFKIINGSFENGPHDAKPLWLLGKSLMELSMADAAIFGKDWENYRGCRIEHECAKRYGVKILKD